jgi:hypothetical protein
MREGPGEAGLTEGKGHSFNREWQRYMSYSSTGIEPLP